MAPPTANDLHLFALPQELQDMIFEFAYPLQDEISIILAIQWFDDEDGRTACYVLEPRAIQPCRPVTLTQLLVSKSYFIQAMRSLLGNQLITLGDRICDQAMREFLSNGMCYAFMREEEIREASTEDSKPLPQEGTTEWEDQCRACFSHMV